MVHAHAQRSGGRGDEIARGANEEGLGYIGLADATDQRTAARVVERQVPQQVAVASIEAIRPVVVLLSGAAKRSARRKDQPFTGLELDLCRSPDLASVDGDVFGSARGTRRRILWRSKYRDQTADQ